MPETGLFFANKLKSGGFSEAQFRNQVNENARGKTGPEGNFSGLHAVVNKLKVIDINKHVFLQLIILPRKIE